MEQAMRYLRFRSMSIVITLFFLTSNSGVARLSPYQDELGTAHVAVLSVGNWEDYRDAVTPKFELNSQQALASAGSTTRAIEEKLVDLLELAFRVATPSTGTTSASTTTTNPTGTETISTSTTSETPGDVSALAKAVPSSPPSASSLPPSDSILKSSLSVDAMSQHWLGTALYQEVQLLDRYIKDAAARRNYEPYVVRLQLSMMPRRRNLTYDAYANLSFFSGLEVAGLKSPKPTNLTKGKNPKSEIEISEAATTFIDATEDYKSNVRVLNSLKSASSSPEMLEDLRLNATELSEKEKQANEALDDAMTAAAAVRIVLAQARALAELPDSPVVIPLLVTDNLEATAHSKAIDQIRQFGLALTAMISGFGGNAEVSRRVEDLNTTSGRDYNSLLTVGRATDNTIRVRLGAAQGVENTFEALPRTHSITLLLLVPQGVATSDDRTLRLQATTEFVNDHGKPFKRRPTASRDRVLDKLARKYEHLGFLPIKRTQQILQTLSDCVARSQQRCFVDELQKCVNADQWASFPRDLFYTDLASTIIANEHSSTIFEVPPAAKLSFFPTQTPIMKDDGKSAAAVVLTGATRLDADRLTATAHIRGAQPMDIPASGVAVDKGRRNATFTFPSLAALKLDMTPSAPAGYRFDSLTVEAYDRTPSNAPNVQPASPPIWRATYPSGYYVKIEPPKPDRTYDISLASEFLLANEKGDGVLNVYFTLGKPEMRVTKLYVEVDGADVRAFRAVGDSKILDNTKQLVMVGDGFIQLELFNLSPVTPVKIRAYPDPIKKEHPVEKSVRVRFVEPVVCCDGN